jgi:hypothetical protein
MMNVRSDKMKTVMIAAAALLAFAPPLSAKADDAAFLLSLSGQWTGGGSVKTRTNRAPINVSCSFSSVGKATSLSLNGACRGFVVISRKIGADVKISKGRYRGTYIGAGTGPAGLTGRRQGDALQLDIRWAKAINGDRNARLTVEKIGARGMRLTTRDRDPATGKTVVTSRIDLKRK